MPWQMRGGFQNLKFEIFRARGPLSTVMLQYVFPQQEGTCIFPAIFFPHLSRGGYNLAKFRIDDTHIRVLLGLVSILGHIGQNQARRGKTRHDDTLRDLDGTR